MLGNAKMRADIQDIFIKTPHHKQVMMFSATMPEEIKKSRYALMYTARNSYKMNLIFSLMKESSSCTVWLNSMSILMRIKSSKN